VKIGLRIWRLVIEGPVKTASSASRDAF